MAFLLNIKTICFADGNAFLALPENLIILRYVREV